MLLEAKDIWFRYDKQDSWVLENISLQIKEGEVTGIVAPSGFGKSTLCKLLSGYRNPQKGQILLDGKPLFDYKGFCPVQLIHQHPEKAINPRWTMKKVLEETGQQDKELLERIGLEEAWMNRFPRELSGGELQRFCVARALIPATRFFLADEMTTMLDVITQAQIWKVVLEIAKERNMGVLVVTHSEELAKQICTRQIDLTQMMQRKDA